LHIHRAGNISLFPLPPLPGPVSSFTPKGQPMRKNKHQFKWKRRSTWWKDNWYVYVIPALVLIGMILFIMSYSD
jgi:hypothetical protein